LPGPYWQDQDDAGYGYGSGWRGVHDRPPREESPWDDNGVRFWRVDSGRGRDDSGRGRGDGGPRHQDGRHREAQFRDRLRAARSLRRAADGASQEDSSWPEVLAGRSRGAQRGDQVLDQSANRGGRFSQTADDLRNRLGMRGRAGQDGSGRGAGRPDEDFWEPARSRATRGSWTAAVRSRTGRDGEAPGRDGYRAGRQARQATAAGYREDYPNGRTALREQPDFWEDGAGGRRGLRSRVVERPDVRRGGGGNGGGGRRGGGPGWNGMPRSRGEGFKHRLIHGSWWRHWTWRKALGVLGCGFAACCLLGIAGFFIIYEMTPIPTDVSETAGWQSSSVYFSNGKLLGTFTNNQGINRQLLTTSQIPQVMDNAMIAAEDRNFYHEGGISLTGIARAAYEDVFGSGGLQGGSTITEQYAKNYYSNIGASRTASTKIKEIFIAIKLAHERSKPWILTNYLNTVDFGDDAYGVGAAAEAYFDINLAKPGATLSVGQAAMLAAMPNQPSYLTPNPTAGGGYTALVKRWQYVLANMVRDNAITQQQANALCANCALPQAEQAFTKNIKISTANSSDGWTGYTGYLMQMVEQELTSPPFKFSQTEIDTGGLQITTTFSESLVRSLAAAVNEEKQQMAADGTPMPEYDHFGISLEDPATGAILAVYGGPGYLSDTKRCDELDCQYNMAEAPHPVGSSMKPYVLATAIEQGMDVQDSILNGYQPLWIPPDWTPADRLELSSTKDPFPTVADATSNGWWLSDSDSDLGPVSVTKAAALSSDPAFTDLAHRVGVQNIINMAAAFGVGQNPFNEAQGNDLTLLNNLFGPKGSIPGSVQIALGQGNLTPIEQASTFATLADDGTYHTPHVISRLYVDQKPVNLQAKYQTRQVLSPSAAADEDYALSFDNVYGTAYPNAAWDRPVIGKTGTLGNGSTSSEAWFVGAIPQYAMAVGLWTNSQAQDLDNLASLGGIGGSFGGAWPAATWQAFMANQFSNLPVVPLPTPNYVGFSKWVQAQPVKKTTPTCKPGQFLNCTCLHGFGRHCGPNPNPVPSCGEFGLPCSPTSPTPSTSPTCNPVFGQPCNTPSPGPSPAPSVGCTPTLGQPCTGDQTADQQTSKSNGSAVSAAAIQPAEEASSVTASARQRAVGPGG
jgi:membrane peptidoglycan carboxypeptidase